MKYFTPSIEDIRIGYECEIHTNSSLGWVKLIVQNKISKDTIIPKGYNSIVPSILYDYYEQNKIRVPYLTKEQIESEGWVYEGAKGYNLFGYDVEQGFHNAFEKGNYIIQGRSLTPSSHHLKIFDTSNGEGAMCIYEGDCKDINTFRYICKLLGI